MDKQTAYKELHASTAAHWVKMLKLWPALRDFALPEVIVNTRTFRSAGYASYEDHSINYSLKLYTFHAAEFHSIIVPHECIHLVCKKLDDPRQHHGPEWKARMVQYGIPPAPYHNMKYPPKDNS